MSEEFDSLVYGLKTTNDCFGVKMKIFRFVGMDCTFVYSESEEMVIIHHNGDVITYNYYEFLDEFGAHHLGTDDITFEDVCEQDLLFNLDRDSNRFFPNSAKLFDKVFKPMNDMSNLIGSISCN